MDPHVAGHRLLGHQQVIALPFNVIAQPVEFDIPGDHLARQVGIVLHQGLEAAGSRGMYQAAHLQDTPLQMRQFPIETIPRAGHHSAILICLVKHIRR